MNFLFQAHSGLRYLVLLAAVLAIGYHLYGLLARRPVTRGVRITASAYAGLLGLQILLGLGLMATGIYYGALIGHLVMMLLAIGAVHMTGAMARRAAEPKNFYEIRLTGLVVSLVLIVLGIAAIGRSVLQSGVMSG
jgi:hypothetical protein